MGEAKRRAEASAELKREFDAMRTEFTEDEMQEVARMLDVVRGLCEGFKNKIPQMLCACFLADMMYRAYAGSIEHDGVSAMSADGAAKLTGQFVAYAAGASYAAMRDDPNKDEWETEAPPFPKTRQ